MDQVSIILFKHVKFTQFLNTRQQDFGFVFIIMQYDTVLVRTRGEALRHPRMTRSNFYILSSKSKHEAELIVSHLMSHPRGLAAASTTGMPSTPTTPMSTATTRSIALPAIVVAVIIAIPVALYYRYDTRRHLH